MARAPLSRHPSQCCCCRPLSARHAEPAASLGVPFFFSCRGSSRHGMVAGGRVRIACQSAWENWLTPRFFCRSMTIRRTAIGQAAATALQSFLGGGRPWSPKVGLQLVPPFHSACLSLTLSLSPTLSPPPAAPPATPRANWATGLAPAVPRLSWRNSGASSAALSRSPSLSLARPPSHG